MSDNSKEIIEALVAEIGESVYIDVAKWHLYLSDAKLDQVLAEKLYPILAAGEVTNTQIISILEGIKVSLGGGKVELPLNDLLPTTGVQKIHDILSDILQEL